MIEQFGTAWWAIALVAFIAGALCVEKTISWFLTFLVGGVALLCFLAGPFVTVALIYTNLWGVVSFICLYLILGAGWALFRWQLFLPKLREDLQERMKRNDHFNNNMWSLAADGKTIIPNLSYHTERITCWIAYWPWSVFNFILSDALVALFKGVFRLVRESLEGLFNALSAHAFKGIEKKPYGSVDE